MARKPEKPDKSADKLIRKESPRANLPKAEAPRVNDELNGFDIKIDSFGEIKSTMSIDQINKFLNRNVDDKKLRDRDDLEFIQDKNKPKKKQRKDDSPDE